MMSLQFTGSKAKLLRVIELICSIDRGFFLEARSSNGLYTVDLDPACLSRAIFFAGQHWQGYEKRRVDFFISHRRVDEIVWLKLRIPSDALEY